MNAKEFMDALAASPVATQIDQPNFTDVGNKTSLTNVVAELDKKGHKEWARELSGR